MEKATLLTGSPVSGEMKRGRASASWHAEGITIVRRARYRRYVARQAEMSRPMGITMATTTTKASYQVWRGRSKVRIPRSVVGLVSGDGQKSAEQLRNYYSFREKHPDGIGADYRPPIFDFRAAGFPEFSLARFIRQRSANRVSRRPR